MAKKQSFPKCPACKQDIKNHKKADALECVESLGLELPSDIYLIGKQYANLKSIGQKHGNRNIITLQFGKRFVQTVDPEFEILHEVLETQAKKEPKDEETDNDEGSEGSAEGSGEDS